MNCSVIIPTYKGAKCLPFTIRSLAKQSNKDFDAIFVIKPSGDGSEELVKRMCEEGQLRNEIVIQKEGRFTHALNLGMKYADGDVVIFTDDDAIPPSDWVEKHLKIHAKLRRIGAVSGHISYYDTNSRRFSRAEVDRPLVNVYRRLIRPVLDRPHRLLRRFKWGVYVTTDYRVAAGSHIPYRPCLSLPCRGVNMSFKLEAIKQACFPEHPALRVAPFCEQFVGTQIALNGWNMLYTPDIFVYHIVRESLSRGKRPEGSRLEISVMREMFRQLLK
jgi:glycosyltransferase involved in cell wall biosynthesis